MYLGHAALLLLPMLRPAAPAPAACAAPFLMPMPRRATPAAAARAAIIVRCRCPLSLSVVIVRHRCQSSLSVVVVRRCGQSFLSLSVVVIVVGCGSLSCIVLPIMSAAPSMAEGTTSVEPASGAEKAPTARPEAFGAQGI